MLCNGWAAAAVSKSSRIFRCFGNFHGDGGNLDLGMLRKVPCASRKFISCRKNGLKRTFSGKFFRGVDQMGAKEKKCVFFRQPSPPPPIWPKPVSSTVPLQTTVLACEPLERASNETAAVLVSCSRNYGPPCMFTWLVLNSKDIWNYSKCIRHFLKI